MLGGNMFGITVDDLRILSKIESYGLTVGQAYELFERDELPEELRRAIQEYEDRLEETQ